MLGDARNFIGTAHLVGNSVVTLASAAYTGSTWIVDAGSVLDLGGKTVAVDGIAGGGTVSNGTLVVSNLIVDGTEECNDLTIKGNLVLADGARVTVLAPECHPSRVSIGGKLTLATGEVAVRLSSKRPFNDHAILAYRTQSAETTLDRWPCGSNLPEGAHYGLKVRHSAGSYTLSGCLAGTMFIFK